MSFRFFASLFLLILSATVVLATTSQDVPYYTDYDLLRYSEGSDTPQEPMKKENHPLFSNSKAPPKVYRVKYTPFEGITKRIIVTATFNDSFRALVAIDTGADSVVISRALAKRMGLLKDSEGKLLWQASGIGGSTSAIVTILDSVEIGGAKVEFVPVLITSSLSEHFDGLVGMDFLSNFSVFIDSKNSELVLEEKPERKKLPAGRDRHWWKANFRRFNHYRNFWLKTLKSFKESSTEMDGEILKLLKRQYREAERLFYRLNNYAIEHNVPLSWREY